jgi:Holliday junction DNA helicase RuvA
MFAKLSGLLDSVGTNHAVIDVGGVGYLVHLAGRTLAGLPAIGAPISLTIETQVREDAIQLYGFTDARERDWFRLLQTVQGVGARVALNLLSALHIEELERAIALQERAQLTRADGVGQRLAERIMVELKGKLPAWSDLSRAAPGKAAPGPGPSVTRDAISALIKLGYRQAEALAAIGRAEAGLGAEPPLEALIKASLRELAP